MIRKQRGVTLMELMTVVAIISILAAIAYPSYRAQVRRSNRTEARVALEQTAGALEKCYTRYMAYDDTANCPAPTSSTGALQYTEGPYRISADPHATQFTVTARHRAGSQATPAARGWRSIRRAIARRRRAGDRRSLLKHSLGLALAQYADDDPFDDERLLLQVDADRLELIVLRQ